MVTSLPAPPVVPTSVPRAIWAAIWRLLAFYCLFGGLLAAWFVPLTRVLPGFPAAGTLPLRLLLEGGAALSLLAATWVMTRLVEWRPLATAGLSPRGLAGGLALGVPLGAAWLGVVLAAAAVAGWLAPVPFTLRAAALAGGVLIAVLNVLTQQWLLSGYAYTVLRERAGLAVALVVSAAMFSAMHLAGYHGAWLPSLNVALAGLVFVVARERSGAVWLGAGIHAGWNGLLGPVLGLSVSGGYQLGRGWKMLWLAGPPWWTGGAFGIEGGLLTTLATLVLLGALIALVRPASARAPAPQR